MWACRCGCESLVAGRPATPRVFVYIDGQNLFRSAHRCFNDVDVPYANYDPMALGRLAASWWPGCVLGEVRFYTGKPGMDIDDAERYWAVFWTNKVNHFSGYRTPTRFVSFTRTLAYRFFRNRPPEGREKGIDVRLALDLLLGAIDDQYDIAVVFSQDKDLNEAVDSVHHERTGVAGGRVGRWIHLESAFPIPDASTVMSRTGNSIDQMGLANTRWRKLDRATYRACRDTRDFRPTMRSGQVTTYGGDFEYVGHETASNCTPNPAARQSLRAGDRFPPCLVCGDALLFARYRRFR